MSVRFTFDGLDGVRQHLVEQAVTTHHKADLQMSDRAASVMRAHASGLREAALIADCAYRSQKEAERLHQQEPVPVEMRSFREVAEELGVIDPRIPHPVDYVGEETG